MQPGEFISEELVHCPVWTDQMELHFVRISFEGASGAVSQRFVRVRVYDSVCFTLTRDEDDLIPKVILAHGWRDKER